MAEKIIKNTPYIDGEKLIQEQITFAEDKKKKVVEFTETVVLIENIWDDLKSTSGQWKWNGKKYFYWETEVTSLEDETVKVNIEAPVPTREVFADEEGNVDLEVADGDSDWAKYWKTLMTTAEENHESESKIIEDHYKTTQTTLIDYSKEGGEAYSAYGEDIPKNDDKDLISNLQSILF